jgi:uncharacterized membrane protein
VSTLRARLLTVAESVTHFLTHHEPRVTLASDLSPQDQQDRSASRSDLSPVDCYNINGGPSHSEDVMDPIAMIIGTSWVVTGLLLIGVSIPLVRGWVKPNHWYGVRLPQSFRSEEAWFAMNRFGGQRLIFWAVPLVLVGVGALFLPLQVHPEAALAVGFVPCICLAMAAFDIFRFARHYQSRD